MSGLRCHAASSGVERSQAEAIRVNQSHARKGDRCGIKASQRNALAEGAVNHLVKAAVWAVRE
jgi:hypothetical protein